MKPSVIVAVVALATVHTDHRRLAPIAQHEVLAGASSNDAPWTMASDGRRSAVHLSQPDAVTKGRIADAYGKQPLGFEGNRGQTGGDVQFVSRGPGYVLFIKSTEAVLALRKPAPEPNQRTSPTLLRMKLVDSNPSPHVSERDELPGKANYIIGGDRRNWHTQVPRYGKVKYEGIYPGVDLVYYGNQQQLEYDFVVAPGANPNAIELAFEGAQDIHVDAGGNLLLGTRGGEIRVKTPVIYQETGGHRVDIPGGYRKTRGNRVGFFLGSYDSTRPLVIDPVLIYSTYLGGSSQDFALGIATDQEGSAYVTGFATSIDFPTSGALQPACGYPNCNDAFITKLRNGTIEYSTYLGGTSDEAATGIAVRPDTREAYITGWTRSRDFPTVNAVDPVFDSSDHIADQRAFVAKLTADGSELMYSTYLGGQESFLLANGIALDVDGAAYVTGATSVSSGGSDVFVTKLTPDGSAVAYSNRFGGSGADIAYAIAVDAGGYASVTGATDSADFPRYGPSQPPSRGFAAKLVPDGSAFVYSTYLFGTGTGLAVGGPNTYITGAFTQYGGSTDAFVEVLDSGGQVLNFAPYGGTGEDRGSTIAIDFAGNVWIAGVTTSTDFPLINPLQGQLRDLDAFVVKFNPRLVPAFSTYLGGSGREQLETEIGSLPAPPGPALALANFGGPLNGLAYVAGFTDSIDFPTAGARQPATNGAINSFVALIFDDGVSVKPNLIIAEIGAALGGVPAEAELGASLHYVFQVTNGSPASSKDVVFFDKLPAGVIVNGMFWQPSYAYPRTCSHDASWVFCDLGPLSETESVTINIDVTPTTLGAQINTAAVVDASRWQCPTCVSTPFFNWVEGFTQDLIWGADADTDQDVRNNTVTTTATITPGSADVSLSGSASSEDVMLDGTVTYTFDVENHGPAATAATFIDTLPPGAIFISATQAGSFGSCAGTNVITCQWPSLSGIARVTIAVRASAPGTLMNTAVVSSTASDPNAANNTVTFVTRVNRPPTANAGPDQIAFAGANCQAIVTLNGTASSDLDGDTLSYVWTAENLLPPPIVFSPNEAASGSLTGSTPSRTVPLGTHTITLTVNDDHGGTASDTVVVTVRDAIAPTFSGVPGPMTIEQSNPSGTATIVAMPTAADNCSGSVAVSSNAPATFPPGVTTVTFTGIDAAGNSATAATTVTVVDTTPPTFSNVPAPMTVEQSMAPGASANVPTPTATDIVSGSVKVSSNAPATFPPGATTVTFTARDAAGNSASVSTIVNVVDTTPPFLAIAAPEARTYLHSDVLTLNFSAADAGSGLPMGMPTAALDSTAVTNGQTVSMLTLSLGSHTLVLSATDVARNSRSQSVSFTIVATLDSLIASVNVFAGQNKIDDSTTVNNLLKKLTDAKQAIERGKRTAAIDKLQEFIDQVNAQQGHHIAVAAAQILSTDAQFVIGTF